MTEFAQEVWPVGFVRPRMFYKENANGISPVPDTQAKAILHLLGGTPATGGSLSFEAKWFPGDPIDAASRLTFKDTILWSEPPPNVTLARSGLPQDIGSALIWPVFITSRHARTSPTVTITISQMDVVQWTKLDININSLIGPNIARRQEEDLEEKAAVVLAAEQRQFTDPDDRRIVKDLLEEAAETLYRTNERRWEPVVWSAIRRYASMLSRSEIGNLTCFLACDGPIDARQVTLQAIQNIFEVAPPPAGNEYRQLQDRVFQMAHATLQPGALAPGKAAALAMNAVAAVAALGDPRLPECVQAVRAWGRPWFTRQVTHVLQELSANWPAHNPAAVQVAEATSALTAA